VRAVLDFVVISTMASLLFLAPTIPLGSSNKQELAILLSSPVIKNMHHQLHNTDFMRFTIPLSYYLKVTKNL
jgi:hypothetical protein